MRIHEFRLLSALLIATTCLASPVVAQFESQYAALAESLASPAYFSVEEAKHGHSDVAIMTRLEIARNRLYTTQGIVPDLAALRGTTLPLLDACYASMEELDRLDDHSFDMNGIIERVPNATPGLYKVYKRNSNQLESQLSNEDAKGVADLIIKTGTETVAGIKNNRDIAAERQKYQGNYAKLRQDAHNHFARLIPVRYANKPKASSPAVVVGIDGSWNNCFSADWIYLQNHTATDLTNCSIFVELLGANAKSGDDEKDQHFHFVSKWPAGSWIYAKYPSRSAKGIATNQSTDSIRSVKVWLYTDELQNEVVFPYKGKEYDSDVERYFDTNLKPQFFGKWYSDNLIADNGFELRYEGGMNRFPPCSVTLTIQEGDSSKSMRWRVGAGAWSAGEKWYLSDKSFNGWDPDTVSVLIEFPHSAITYTTSWDRRASSWDWEGL
jgi:hypothetical protein